VGDEVGAGVARPLTYVGSNVGFVVGANVGQEVGAGVDLPGR